MSKWFRMYAEVLNDPKAQRLSGDDFKGWVNVLCLACQHDGAIPADDDLAFALRVDVKKVAKLMRTLTDAALIDCDETGRKPHNWDGRQYKSDVSTDRVKRFRNGKRNVSPDVSETAPEAEQNRNRAEQTQTAAQEDFEPGVIGWVGDVARAAGLASTDTGRIAEQNLIVRGWIDAGADRDTILKAIERALPIAKSPPRFLKYFDGAVRDAIAGAVRADSQADSLVAQAARYRKAAA